MGSCWPPASRSTSTRRATCTRRWPSSTTAGRPSAPATSIPTVCCSRVKPTSPCTTRAFARELRADLERAIEERSRPLQAEAFARRGAVAACRELGRLRHPALCGGRAGGRARLLGPERLYATLRVARADAPLTRWRASFGAAGRPRAGQMQALNLPTGGAQSCGGGSGAALSLEIGFGCFRWRRGMKRFPVWRTCRGLRRGAGGLHQLGRDRVRGGARRGRDAGADRVLDVGARHGHGAHDCIVLSLRYRMPVLTAWSTPGAALLITSVGGVPMARGHRRVLC